MSDVKVSIDLEREYELDEDETVEEYEEATYEAFQDVIADGVDLNVTATNIVDGLDKANVRSDVYVIEHSGQTVSTAKSQFAEEHDVDYSDLTGKIIDPGYGRNFPRYVVVMEKMQ